MAGHYELGKSENGQFYFVLKAGNGETILQSEQYQSKASALNGIASVQANCGNEALYERKPSRDGQHHFTLKAANHQVIGSSETYKSTAGRDGGIASVQSNGPSTTIKDLTAT